MEALLDCPAQALVLKMESVEQCCTFTVAQIDSSGFAGSWQILAQQVDLLPYSTLEANRFTGTFLGMYATSSGQPSDNFADFDWFSYQGIDQ